MAKKEKSEAAEKIVKAEKAKSKKQKSDKPGAFARFRKSTVRFFKDFRGEIKKIVWPDLKMVLKSSGVVIASIAIFLVFIWLIDLGLSKSIDLLSDVARGADSGAGEDAGETPTAADELEGIIDDETADETEKEEEASVSDTAESTDTGD
jgi:preprotein translocase subunit SecE